MALTGRTALIAALGALFVGLLLPSWVGIGAVTGAVLLAVLADLVLAAPVRSLRIVRGGATTVRLGDTASVELTVTNPSGRPLRALIRDAWAPSAWRPGTAETASRHTLAVPGGERRLAVSVLAPSRRGDHHAHRVTVRSLGPLGLAGRQGSHHVPWTVRALPPFHSRKHLPSRLARLRELDGRTSVLTRGQGTEFDSLREYLPGDDVRSIDWRASARRHTVAVRTWRPERDRHILVVLDTGRTSAGRVGDAPRLDAALDAALLLTALATRAGDRVDLLAHDARKRAAVIGSSPSEILPAFTNAMALLEPALHETDMRSLVSTALRMAPHRSLIVLLTGLDAAPVEDGLRPLLPLLTKRHEVVLASVADPHLDVLAAGRGTVEAVYGAAAAERTRADRRHTADRLTRHGVTVLDAPPAQIAPALADTYLALKAAGRL
ncbi:DUF58 domain-containing protein [Kitasatospora aureofaciens]|uniref:Lipoprotein n=1 Tax=Kitasatospora aureofaciens TaxID=1894 RepID=A0A1E7MWP4_KITAU|nr:DUF58 domain-containing protein [Kitasatospora aureofaciens]QEV01374.1 DUF58 domain-containing protein [Streptomyces viridifaciens]ARF80133.1 DUF58 domain-containing protein [Kitasatospora aureofaciens]OEV32839.1 hypothetical protein HS99_0039900 [Kitasatospora aureofaciens]UKZ07758.1 DUF58 domain-containing protein [Streptomyces viridifaciens]GGU96975.1 lipoprotein [Kitasatospora aureofaciens]